MRRKVLVVDDDAMVRRVVATILDLEEYEVVTAASATEALALVAVERPDVVVCDVMMPEMDGFELVEKLRANEARTYLPVVMLTARDDSSDRATARTAGADAYVTKPFSPLALINEIEALLPRRR